MPIAHGDDSPKQALASLVELSSVRIDAVSARDQRALRAQLEAVESAAKAGDLDSVCDALDDLLRALEAHKTARFEALALALDPCANALDPVARAAGWAWALVGRERYCSAAFSPAIAALERAEELLARFDDSPGRNRYTVALKYHALALAQTDPDSAIERLGKITAIAEQTREPSQRNRAIETCAQLVDHLLERRPSDVVAICQRALGLDRADATRFTWEVLLECSNGEALALRRLGRDGEALDACARTVELAANARSENAAVSLAWALCEGAFIAAERVADADAGLRFVSALRAQVGAVRDDTDKEVIAELAYAVSMEARCFLLKAESARALAACDEAVALAARAREDRGARGAHAAALRVKGEALSLLGREEEARAAWSECVERFIADDSDDVRDEANRARALLG
jgi:tetratricopeptide (TPR) repeat protein